MGQVSQGAEGVHQWPLRFREELAYSFKVGLAEYSSLWCCNSGIRGSHEQRLNIHEEARKLGQLEPLTHLPH
jgi:hypothetical protein